MCEIRGDEVGWGLGKAVSATHTERSEPALTTDLGLYRPMRK